MYSLYVLIYNGNCLLFVPPFSFVLHIFKLVSDVFWSKFCTVNTMRPFYCAPPPFPIYSSFHPFPFFSHCFSHRDIAPQLFLAAFLGLRAAERHPIDFFLPFFCIAMSHLRPRPPELFCFVVLASMKTHQPASLSLLMSYAACQPFETHSVSQPPRKHYG